MKNLLKSIRKWSILLVAVTDGDANIHHLARYTIIGGVHSMRLYVYECVRFGGNGKRKKLELASAINH